MKRRILSTACKEREERDGGDGVRERERGGAREGENTRKECGGRNHLAM